MRYLTMIPLLFSTVTFAQGNIFFKTSDVTEYHLETVSRLKIESSFQGEIDSGSLSLNIRNVDFETYADEKCDEYEPNKACLKVEALLEQAGKVQIRISEFDQTQNIFIGDIYIDGKNLAHELIRQGAFKYDYRQSRNKIFVLMQKEAMCNGRGIWAKESSFADIACN